MFQPVETERIAAHRDDAVERRLAAHKGAIGQIGFWRDLLVHAQAGARRVRFGLDVELCDAECDEPLQLLDAFGDRRRLGQREPRLEDGERLLVLVVAVVIACDDEQRVAALDRIGRFEIGVVSRRRDVIVTGRREVLREPQPDEPVIGAKGDRARQILDRLGIALGAVLVVRVLPQPRDQRRLALIGRNVANELLAVIGARLGQVFRLVFLGKGRRGEQDEQQQRKCLQHAYPRDRAPKVAPLRGIQVTLIARVGWRDIARGSVRPPYRLEIAGGTVALCRNPTATPSGEPSAERHHEGRFCRARHHGPADGPQPDKGRA